MSMTLPHPTEMPDGLAMGRPHIAELFLPDSRRRYGFRIGGANAGPNLVVACQTALAQRVYQRLMLIPTLNRMRGTLFLLIADRVEESRDPMLLDRLPGLKGPVDFMLTLPSLHVAGLEDAAVAELVARNYWAVLRTCARMGMVQGRGIPDAGGTLLH